VAFQKRAEPFVVKSIYELISLEMFQIIQFGITQRLKRPVTIMARWERKLSGKYPVKLIRIDDQWLARLDPLDPHASYCEYCNEIRRSKKGEKKGEEKCFDFDARVVAAIMKEEMPESRWYPCWAGMVDCAIPVIIDHFVIAVFLTGQLRCDDRECEEAFTRGIAAATEITGVDKDDLHALADAGEKRHWSELDAVSDECKDYLEIIKDVAKDKYEMGRQVQDAEFMDEVFAYFAAVDSEDSLWVVLTALVKRVAEFTFFGYTALLMNRGDAAADFVVKAPSEFGQEAPGTLELTEDEVERLFRREGLFVLKEGGAPKEEGLYAKTRELIGRDVESVLLFSYSLSRDRKCILLVAERVEGVTTRKSQRYISETTKKFLERVGHEIKQELYKWLSIKEKDDLLINAAHVLRAPLTRLCGATEHLVTLIADGKSGAVAANAEEMGKLCGTMDNVVSSALRQMETFLMCTRGEMKSEPYRFKEDISLRELLRECAESVEHLTIRNKIRIIVEASDELPRTYADGEKLRIAFSNIIENGVKFSYRSQTVDIRVSFDRAKDTYEISVSNIGNPVRESEKEKIFEKHYRSKCEDPDRLVPGTGIGLTVAREIIKRHDGKIWVTSKRAERISYSGSHSAVYDTTFWIELPRKRNPA
jgi:signal transduction histidine kinase/ligand-binding sensor protein